MIPREGMVELHDVIGGGLSMIHGTITDMTDVGVEVTRSTGLGEYEATFIPWIRVRHVTMKADRPR